MRRSKYIKLASILFMAASLIVPWVSFKAQASVGRFRAGELLTQFRTAGVPNSGRLVDVHRVGALAIEAACAPSGLWMQEDGALLVTDIYNKVIWKTDRSGVSIAAGKVTVADIWGEPLGGYGDGQADQAMFGRPWAIAPFMGGYAISDPANHVVRLLKDGKVRTIAGNGKPGFADGDATTLSVMMDTPTGLAADGQGHLYIADTGNNAIRRISESGTVSTCVRGLNEPTGLCFADNTLYVADSGAGRVCTLTGLNSEGGAQAALAVLSGGVQEDREEAGFRDGANAQALFSNPQGVLAGADGAVYVADTGNGAVRVIKNGQTSTLLKMDSQAMDAYPVSPVGLALDGNSLYIADAYTRTLLRLSLE